jgi:hypothetical protein
MAKKKPPQPWRRLADSPAWRRAVPPRAYTDAAQREWNMKALATAKWRLSLMARLERWSARASKAQRKRHGERARALHSRLWADATLTLMAVPRMEMDRLDRKLESFTQLPT